MSTYLFHLRESLKLPGFWLYSSWLDIITRYRRTRLGLLWIVIPTAVFIGVIGGVYSRVMGHDPAFYLPYLAIGYVLFRFMTQSLAESGSIMRSHKAFIMDGRTRLSDYVLRSIAKAFFYFACSVLVIIGALLWSPMYSVWNVLTLLLTFPVIVLNAIWLSTCTSMIGARYPDSGEMINTAMRFGLLLTPILWVGDRFPAGTFGWWAVHLNPAYHLITFARNPILGEAIPMATVSFIVGLTVAGWGLAIVLYRRYARFVPLWI
ncbi:ABC transporter permease [Luteimonas kalidii]|uniref:ABC transporter permease n=1 Tax=Luteimonas kalidii TaxID=3042025 RepID=A0ABT6JXL6_9GAMM|nr:ABC transporter permease [Luteimonas kalidii]MDH5835432.1 ABC transporter permease [Luteimonas kalidii]